ncbi:MAG: thiamine pyrophosphate-dependent enzyme, partial [Candidatus Zixiibacteriota bacterium]
MNEKTPASPKKKKEPVKESLVAPGHRACAGCGELLAARLVMNAAGENTIATCATGCLEVVSSAYPQSAWKMPWIHSLFENPAAVATGIEAALRALGREDEANVIAQGGDGSTADIGIGCLSGVLERGDNILYICYDNEAYMNTGVQRSGLTPFEASTTTAPSGKISWGKTTDKKPMPEIAAAHGIPYVATASVGYYR